MKTQHAIFLGLLPLAWCADFTKAPSCSTSCVSDYIKSTGCGSNDWTCLCNASLTLKSTLDSCVRSSCSISDTTTFTVVVAEVCYGAQASSIISSVTANILGTSTAAQTGPTAVATVTEGGSTFTVMGTATAGISQTSAAASSSGSSSGGLSPGAIAGIVVGSVVGIAALVGLAFLFGRRKGKQGQPQAASAEAPQMQPAPFAGAPTSTLATAPAPVNTFTPPPGYPSPSPMSTPGVVPIQVVGESKVVEMDATAGAIRCEMPHSEQTRPELSPQTAPNRHELGVEHPTTVYELGGSR